MKKKLKISSTAYRVLTLLHKLNENKYSVDDLNNIFSEDPSIERFFSKDVILKYISTLRTAGYDISKPTASNNYCYRLNKAPVQIEFSEEEISALALLKHHAQSLYQKRIIKHYSSYLEKLKRFMTNEQIEKLEDEFIKLQQADNNVFKKFEQYKNLIKKIEQCIIEKQKVEIKYKLSEKGQERKCIAELQYIQYELNDISIIYYDSISAQMNGMKIAHITDIKQLPFLTGERKCLSPVIFKLSGKLAKTYRLYEKEKISNSNETEKEKTITAYPDNMDSFLKRLIKYGENCKIIYPQYIRTNMLNIIKSTLDNYK